MPESFLRFRTAFWFLVLILDGCAHIETDSGPTAVWQSAPQEPVWVHHALPPSRGNVYLVAQAKSRAGRPEALEKAREKLAESLVKRLEASGLHFTAGTRRTLLERFRGDTSRRNGPLVLVDSWEYETQPDTRNPFLLERHAWILVRAPVNFLRNVEEELGARDRQRFRRIRNRHLRLLGYLKQEDGTPSLILLAKNRRSFREIHAIASFSQKDRERYFLILKEEYGLWNQFLGSSSIRSSYNVDHPLKVTDTTGRKTTFSLYARFRDNFRSHGISGFVPVLSLRPVLPLLPFPPPPILWRGGGVGNTPYRALSLYWSGDLGWYGQYRVKNRLLYRCSRTSGDGKGQCRVDRWPASGNTSLVHVGLVPGDDKTDSTVARDIANKVHGRFPAEFPGPRETHRLKISVSVDPSFHGNSLGLQEEADFLKNFASDLSREGFVVRLPGNQGKVRRRISPREIGGAFSEAELRLHWHPLDARSRILGGNNLVVRRIGWGAEVRDAGNHVLWGASGELSGAGVGRKEALEEAMDMLGKNVSRTLSRLLWVRPGEEPDDRFMVMRAPLLDGRAYCVEDLSP
ncbi:MAG: hypothetical protein ACYCRD_00765 [Leptospirillum sp.]